LCDSHARQKFQWSLNCRFLPGNHHQPQHHHQQQHYQTIINPNIHSGSIPSTGRSSYAPNSFAPHSDKSVEDTRMIIEQANRMMGQKNGDENKAMLPATSYIDQPMLSAMQQMFNNTNSQGMHPQNMKTIYHQPNQPQQIYFN
jgi:hypothetical protein